MYLQKFLLGFGRGGNACPNLGSDDPWDRDLIWKKKWREQVEYWHLSLPAS